MSCRVCFRVLHRISPALASTRVDADVQAALYRRVAATFPEPLRVMDVRVACVYGTGLPTPELVIHRPVPGGTASEALAAAPAPYLVGVAPAPAPAAVSSAHTPRCKHS